MLGYSVGHVKDEAERGAFPAAFRSASGSFAGHELSKAYKVWRPAKDCIMKRSKIVCIAKIQYFWFDAKRFKWPILFGHMFFLDLCFSGFICLSLGGSSGASKNELQKASRSPGVWPGWNRMWSRIYRHFFLSRNPFSLQLRWLSAALFRSMWSTSQAMLLQGQSCRLDSSNSSPVYRSFLLPVLGEPDLNVWRWPDFIRSWCHISVHLVT